MDVVGSEIGQKMRSAIKAKLTELGCYVDDELPDYVMVMVANKRTRAQMEDDLQLFLGDNTESFVNWLHQVLKKLQEVTVPPVIKPIITEKSKDKTTSKEKKSKDKKSKDKLKKTDSSKKAKKKDKEKIHRKKDDKKTHKSKKKGKHHEMIRPNVPPLLMNIEKESEPSITDVFAGQILKNHGINLDMSKEEIVKVVDKKPIVEDIKRPIIPIIDPATIQSHLEPEVLVDVSQNSQELSGAPSISAPREEQIKEMTNIEAKILGLKQKLAEQLDSMSDDEDFLNIRTEAEELMNDFAEDVFQEISQPPPVTPPIVRKSPSVESIPNVTEVLNEPESLPQIELKLPKRPVRERLGTRDEPKKPESTDTEKHIESPERFTPEREPETRQSQPKSAKSRLSDHPEPKKSSKFEETSSENCETNYKRLTSKVSVLESRSSRASCASVVRVRPRPRVSAPASSLLMRAVADAHKSLLNAPAKLDAEPSKVKRALVLPMRRCVDAKKIVIQVPADIQPDGQTDNQDEISLDIDSDDEKSIKVLSDTEKEEYIPASITKKIINSEYQPSLRNETRTSTKKDDTLIVETINIHHTSVDKDKNTQFIVTMDGFSPNAFLAKKLMTEGLLGENEELANTKPKNTQTVLKTGQVKDDAIKKPDEKEEIKIQKRLSNTSDESDTQVIIKQEKKAEKRLLSEDDVKEDEKDLSPPRRKRKASPIVFNVEKKEKEVERSRERTESASSDNHVTVSTTTNSHKYDSLPPLSAAERKAVWCRSFPACRYGAACAFAHPACKFAAACTRRNCVYSHAKKPSPSPVVASHVVPAANYKSITPVSIPGMCKYYPNCVNPTCHYYHPKPCRYGKGCANKLECNFYHSDVPSKWRYPV